MGSRFSSLAMSLGTAAALCIGSGVAEAQSYHVSGASFGLGDWTFNPVYYQGAAPDSNTAAPAPSITGFLALANANSTSGNNLLAVWYQRDPATGTWSSQAWDDANPWTAVKTIKANFSISDDEDGNWTINGVDADVVAQAPATYESGILASDPVADIINSAPDRDAIIQELVAAGYKAADIVVDKDNGCTKDQKLNAMASAEAELLSGDDDTKGDRAISALTNALPDCPGVLIGAVIVIPLPNVPIGTPTTTYKCGTWFSPPGRVMIGTTCQTWTTVTTDLEGQIRIKVCVDPTLNLPYPCGFCYQTRVRTRTGVWSCCSSGVAPSVPACPPPPPPGSTYPTGAATWCTSPNFTGSVSFSAWTPACGF